MRNRLLKFKVWAQRTRHSAHMVGRKGGFLPVSLRPTNADTGNSLYGETGPRMDRPVMGARRQEADVGSRPILA